MRCPFHQDDTPSFKAYPGAGGWHCYGCGEGGSVIDFVMKLFGLTFSQAVIRLDNDFRLGLTGCRSDAREARRQAARLAQRGRERERLRKCLEQAWRRYALLDRALSRYRPSPRTAPAYAAAMAKREYLGYATDELQREMDGEVIGWRSP